MSEVRFLALFLMFFVFSRALTVKKLSRKLVVQKNMEKPRGKYVVQDEATPLEVCFIQ